ncbi:MAG: hypothetical protein AAGH90_03570 [Pseudomonadota bacterium]
MPKSVNNFIGLAGTLLGIFAFFLPAFDQFLAGTMVLAVLLVFMPFQETGRIDKELDQIVQAIRYICVSWVVVLSLQQSSKAVFIAEAPNVARETTLDIRDDKQAGRAIDVPGNEVARKDQFEKSNSYFVQATDDKKAYAVSAPHMIKRASGELASDVERQLFFFGAFLIISALIFRFAAFIVHALTKDDKVMQA